MVPTNGDQHHTPVGVDNFFAHEVARYATVADLESGNIWNWVRAAIPTDLLLRLMNATPEQYAAVEKILATVDLTAAAPVSDDEARRLFALLKALESEGDYRKAPVTRVFQLYCLEGLTRAEVAKRCRCVPALVTLRLQMIEARLGRKASELRQLSGHFERIADSLTDDRARHIRRERATDGDMDEEDGF